MQADDPASEFEKFNKLCHSSQNERDNIAHKFLGEEYVVSIGISLPPSLPPSLTSFWPHFDLQPLQKNIDMLRQILDEPLNCEYTEQVDNTRSIDTRSTDTRCIDTRSTDTRSTDTRSTDTRSTDTRSIDTRSTDTNLSLDSNLNILHFNLYRCILWHYLGKLFLQWCTIYVD